MKTKARIVDADYIRGRKHAMNNVIADFFFLSMMPASTSVSRKLSSRGRSATALRVGSAMPV
jgi:hypothetical protein